MLKSNKKITADLLVTDIVNDNYRAAEVFRKYDIDFCCGGKMPLNTICGLKGLSESDILEELCEFTGVYQNVRHWPLEFMVDYLINIHHTYFENNIPAVQYYINRFALNHHDKFPEIQKLPFLVQQLFEQLTDLLNYESESLFPYIKRIMYAYNIKNEVYANPFISSATILSIEGLDEYHRRIKLLTSQIANLTNDFSLPQNACTTHKVMLQKLHEFIDFSEQHLLLEMKVMIGKVLQTEKSLLGKIY